MALPAWDEAFAQASSLGEVSSLFYGPRNI